MNKKKEIFFTKDQQRAIDAQGNILISAGAGSGKTQVLTARFISLVKKGIRANEILVLTFTKKAAQEMKERIISSLYEENKEEDIKLLNSSNNITTFDSFALTILEKYRYFYNLEKNISVLDPLFTNYLTNLYLEDIFKIRSEIPSFINLITSLGGKNISSFKKNLIKLYNKIDILPHKEEILKNYKIDKEVLIELYKNYLKDLIEDINLNNSILKKYVDNPSYFAFYNLLNTQTYEELRQVILKDLSKTTPSISKIEDEEIEKIVSKIKSDNKSKRDLIKDNVLKYPSYEDFLKEIKKEESNQKEIITIFKELSFLLSNFYYQNNTFSFTEIAKMGVQLLQNAKIKEEVKASYKEIMIDEYQDTSLLQEQFISLIGNNNIYCVGDIKQAIYKFRNASPELFLNRLHNLPNENIILISKNFRSRKEVLNPINDIFSSIMTNDLSSINYKDGHLLEYGDIYQEENDKYKLEFKTYKESSNSDKEEALIIASDIKQKLTNNFPIYDTKKKEYRPIKPSDFVILMDRKKSFPLYKRIFTSFNLPLKIESSEIVNENHLFLVHQNIIKALNIIYKYNYQKLSKNEEKKFIFALSSIARSFLYRIKDDELYHILKNKSYQELPFFNILLELTKEIDNLSNCELFMKISESFQILDKVYLLEDPLTTLKTYDYLKELMETFDHIGFKTEDEDQFLTYLDEERIDISLEKGSEEIDSVKIMTIHASKGLEFPICYFPNLNSGLDKKDIFPQFFYEEKSNYIGLGYKENNLIYDSLLKEIYSYNYLKDIIKERIRLFYVALTRAREKIILVGKENIPFKLPSKIETFYDFLNLYDNIDKFKEEGLINNLEENSEREKEEIKEKYSLMDSVKVNAPLSKKTYSKKMNVILTKEKKEYIEKGLELHSILEYFDFKNPNYENLREENINIVKRFLNAIGSLENVKIYKEYEFIKDNEHGIIDLILEYPEEIKIIDYKLKNISDSNYLKQLEGYKTYLKTKTNKKITTYLYSLLEGKLEEINC